MHRMKILVGLLSCGAAAVWAPQIMPLFKASEPVVPDDLDDEDHWTLEEYGEDSDVDAAAPAGDSEAQEANEVLLALETFMPVNPMQPDPEQWIPVVEGDAAQAQLEASQIPAGRYVPSESVVRFLERQQLTGILQTESSAVALLGSRLVRVGDVLAQGALEVRAIDALTVTLADGEHLHVIELPAFQSRRRMTTEDGDPLDFDEPEESALPPLEAEEASVEEEA